MSVSRGPWNSIAIASKTAVRKASSASMPATFGRGNGTCSAVLGKAAAPLAKTGVRRVGLMFPEVMRPGWELAPVATRGRLTAA
jgi:hypothetical protein